MPRTAVASTPNGTADTLARCMNVVSTSPVIDNTISSSPTFGLATLNALNMPGLTLAMATSFANW